MRAKLHYYSLIARIVLPENCPAFTFGQHIFLRGKKTTRHIFDHEYMHCCQFERYGLVAFFLIYWRYTRKYGYHKNPLEIEARKYADQRFQEVLEEEREQWESDRRLAT